MRVTVQQANITEVKADVLIVNLFEGVTAPAGATGAVDAALDQLITNVIRRGEFTGKLNQTLTIHSPQLPTPRVVVVGLGKRDEFTIERVRQAAGSAMAACRQGPSGHIATIVHGAGLGGLAAEVCAQATTEGSLLAAYTYDTHRTIADGESRTVDELILVEVRAEQLPVLQRGCERGTIMAQAVNYGRDLVNAPGNFSTPRHLAESARQLAAQGELQCSILERDQMEELGMGALLGVAQGSCQPPCLIALTHTVNGSGPKLALVGKGLTYDSGGINLKSGSNMELMRNDMAGGAAVLAAMQAIAQIKPSLTVMGIVPCTENLPSGSALKPGDVLKAMTGKTIEVISTDAEGRLILADAVAYAVSLGATHVVDVATLTGACGVALGEGFYSGIVANSDELVASILAAAQCTGERFWRFPSDPDYKELNHSRLADIRNVGDGLGGAISGGLFIGEFVGETPWAHLDIAPTCYSKKDRPYQPRGATGVATRTLVELAIAMAQD